MTDTSELQRLLAHIGYDQRPQQTALFEHLKTLDHDGVIAQAGTGVGKSIAVLAAAAHLHDHYGKQVLIVTPTRVLMDQYMKSDAPAAAACFGLAVEELRGKAWYACEMGGDGTAENGGCPGFDGGCSATEWEAGKHWCEYRDQKKRAQEADIVITNTDMLIVNDRLVPGEFFDPEGPLLVDEAHQLEPKLRDFSDRSLRADWLKKWSEAGKVLAAHIYSFGREAAKVDPAGPMPGLIRAFMESVEAQGDAGVPERVKTMYESATKILARLNTPSENALVWCDGESLKLSWIDIAASARELLQARPFGLVSATIPKSMPSSLGVSDARIVDVGHPFDYAKQATLSISQINGSYQYSRERSNLTKRAAELQAKVIEAGGGALLLFSSFKDLEAVYEETFAAFKAAGFTILKQDGVLDNKLLGEAFKRDGNAVLFGSESFATGFDAPGDALRFVSIWKLPYPGKDPVTEALMKRFYTRYNDMMLTRVTQAVGRLIRTTSDTGHVWIGDCRAEGKILNEGGLMTKHLKEFKRV
jgi:Rad3-related DNA helicase